MNKRKLHHLWRYLRRIHPLYFLVLAILFGTVSLYALRQNNNHMQVLKNAVYEADKQNGDVEKALRELRSYVYSHMNTSLASGPNAVHPPIQLKYTYERLLTQQQQSLGGDKSDVYNQAYNSCASQGATSTAQSTISCIQDYMEGQGVHLATIPDDLYKFDFTSAKWSPDLAGWSLVATALSFLTFVCLSAVRFVIKHFML